MYRAVSKHCIKAVSWKTKYHSVDSYLSTTQMSYRGEGKMTLLHLTVRENEFLLSDIMLSFSSKKASIFRMMAMNSRRYLRGENLIWYIFIPHAQRSWGGGVYWFQSVRPSVCPSVRPASRVSSVAPKVLVGSSAYSYILSGNFRRCVACEVFLQNFTIWIFWQFFFLIFNFDSVLFWHYNMWGCVFSVYPLPLWWLREHIYFVLLSSSNRKYELLPIV